MLQKLTETNILQVKDNLGPLLPKLGDVVVAERLSDDYFLKEDCGIYLGCGYRQVVGNEK